MASRVRYLVPGRKYVLAHDRRWWDLQVLTRRMVGTIPMITWKYNIQPCSIDQGDAEVLQSWMSGWKPWTRRSQWTHSWVWKVWATRRWFRKQTIQLSWKLLHPSWAKQETTILASGKCLRRQQRTKPVCVSWRLRNWVCLASSVLCAQKTILQRKETDLQNFESVVDLFILRLLLLHNLPFVSNPYSHHILSTIPLSLS